MKKRSFLKSIALAGLGAPLSLQAMDGWLKKFDAYTPQQLGAEDEFWLGIRGSYLLKPDYINLENGYYNILPKEILENYIQHIREVNYQGSYYMRTVQFENKKFLEYFCKITNFDEYIYKSVLIYG